MLQGRFQQSQSSVLDVEFANLMVVHHSYCETGRSECLAAGVDAVPVDGRQILEKLDLCCAWAAKNADEDDASLFNFSFCFLRTHPKTTRCLFLYSGGQRCWAPKMHQLSWSSGVVLFPPSDDSGFRSAIDLSPAIWPFGCVGCSHVGKRALQAHQHKLHQSRHPLLELPWDSSSPHSVRPSGCSRLTAALCQAAISIPANVRFCPARTVSTRSPAARCRCRGNKLSRVLFEHSSSFTVNLSVKTDLSAINHHGDLLPHAGPLHFVCCV